MKCRLIPTKDGLVLKYVELVGDNKNSGIVQM